MPFCVNRHWWTVQFKKQMENLVVVMPQTATAEQKKNGKSNGVAWRGARRGRMLAAVGCLERCCARLSSQWTAYPPVSSASHSMSTSYGPLRGRGRGGGDGFKAGPVQLERRQSNVKIQKKTLKKHFFL